MLSVWPAEVRDTPPQGRPSLLLTAEAAFNAHRKPTPIPSLTDGTGTVARNSGPLELLLLFLRRRVHCGVLRLPGAVAPFGGFI